MRIASGIILLIVGAFVVSMSLPRLISQLLIPITIHTYLAYAAVGLLIGAVSVAGGVSAIMKRRFWLSLAGAVCLVLVAAAGTVFWILWMGWTEIPGHETTPARRLLWSAPAWGGCGIPGILALLFLVKRRGEFQA